MRAMWLVTVIVLLAMGCSVRELAEVENGCDCTTEIYIKDKGFVPLSARVINTSIINDFFSICLHPTETTDVFEYKVRQKGVVYQYDLDLQLRHFDIDEYRRKYLKTRWINNEVYRYKVDHHGQLFILDKDGDWNALTAIGYTLQTSKQP